jgi:hypothetical protein
LTDGGEGQEHDHHEGEGVECSLKVVECSLKVVECSLSVVECSLKVVECSLNVPWDGGWTAGGEGQGHDQHGGEGVECSPKVVECSLKVVERSLKQMEEEAEDMINTKEKALNVP